MSCITNKQRRIQSDTVGEIPKGKLNGNENSLHTSFYDHGAKLKHTGDVTVVWQQGNHTVKCTGKSFYIITFNADIDNLKYAVCSS